MLQFSVSTFIDGRITHGSPSKTNLMEPRLILINLLVKLGVAAAVSSSLVRSKEFKSLLFREERTFRQKIYLVLWFGLPIMVGVWIRISQKSFLAGDLSFETALLLGVIGGRWAGSLGGVLMGIPASAARRVGRDAVRCALWFSRGPTAHHGCATRTTSGRSRRSSIKASFASFDAICRVLACSTGRSCFSATVVGLRFVQTELARHISALDLQHRESGQLLGLRRNLCRVA